ncbi:hypothetical protein [Bradyrhizobium sp. BWA-3-5]|uniref:hypothetical protein n=1 Tax=Bradyrhizobium sp. BWA-3-5 TaxID=3080013 RepID=UPI00293F5175|nr:hypothetical protein [Bradyrhizobium sp. BWA-3-5]WOH68114.1 hypothetical protein RX331_10525 [Bradyrhizobium sp. BWA-3-5]
MTAYVPGITETDLKKVILALQQLAAGRSNAVGSVTLATGSATTTVTARLVGGEVDLQVTARDDPRCGFDITSSAAAAPAIARDLDVYSTDAWRGVWV